MKQIASLILLLIVAFATWWGIMILKTGTEESSVRIRHNLDMQFFDFAENELHKFPIKPSMAEDHGVTTPITNILDVEGFHNYSHGLFNPNEFLFVALDDRRFMIYRGQRPSPSILTTQTLQSRLYDPTNGINSEGYHARILTISN